MILDTKNNNIIPKLTNILDSGFNLGEKVCIVAPGLNGKNHYNEIPDDFSIIAVNKAILINEVNPDWWVIAHTDNTWFNLPDKKFSGIRVYRDKIVPSITKTALEMSKDKVYYFDLEKEPLQEKVVFPVQGCIRYGASVSALSVQIALNVGVREILLCGVDMSGNQYWDNSENEDPNVLHLHGETWDSVKRFNPLLQYMRNKLNIKISTLSTSKLDIPFYTKES
ncbi:motility associated factor glycosyltransferase family protein [Aquimarina sediminis]|uniref:hypothetical protein n=1 Tax=Aquimarina sediminis TaxID=2070536 RepID=UPI000CA02183|nr:hypothetical protein [Aquimarina sediminis]